MAEANILTPFTCQRCSQSLVFEETLSLSEKQELFDLEAQQESINCIHFPQPCTLSDSANGLTELTSEFMMIPKNNERRLTDVDCRNEYLGLNYKVQNALFDAVSGNSNIDHPLCDECTDCMIEMLEEQLKNAQSDYNQYQKYYDHLFNLKEKPNLAALEKELERLAVEEFKYLEEMQFLKTKDLEICSLLDEQEEIADNIEEMVENYKKQHTDHRVKLKEIDEEIQNSKSRINFADLDIKRLKKTNVFNAAFHIWYKDDFGTINNFRLGRLPSKPVAWPEINSAWGQTALLLFSLAKKIDLSFERYEIVPFGSHSRLKVIGEPKELPLYGYGGMRFLWDENFDCAMAAFLDCLQQFQEKIEKDNESFCFPYKINKGKIEDKDISYSIKIQLNSEEQWTKALKFVLTNLKWGLAFVSSQYNNEEEEQQQKNDS